MLNMALDLYFHSLFLSKLLPGGRTHYSPQDIGGSFLCPTV